MSFIPKGILPAMITPLTKDGKVNIPALRKLIDFLITGGVHGIFAIGTTGEFYAISNAEYQEVLEVTVDHVKGRVPVYAGANAIGTRESIALAAIAQKVGGISALSVLTPYFIGLNQNELYSHFAAVAASTSLPIILYDNSPKTHITIKPATVEKLAAIPNIVGIKDSTGDMTNTADIINRTQGKDFYVMMGRDSLIHAALSYGATGAVAATANVAPALVASIYNKYIAGDIAGSLEDQYKLVPLRIAFGLGSFPTVIKEALELLGIEAGPCAAPTGPMTAEEKEQLKTVLIEMELLK
ncbi:MAG: 4-hydroxy-tetrahydrodipicolinate synthase [Spirochaetales bacterium]|jgi:4-hydroxy-tetrahydrodipicolinate synthase|nr:4-hydroxy-tetrahydrodipicolinate synthase [Spirochaetales bacterium]